MTPVTLPAFKRGDSFAMVCTYKRFNGPEPISDSTTIRAQLRDPADALIAELTLQVEDQTMEPGKFVLSASPTQDWPVCDARMDIQFTTGGVIQSTRTARLPIIGDVTR